VPAAAVIPAPIAYIKAVAVKKLVVGFRGETSPVHRTFGEYRLVHLLPLVPRPFPLTRVKGVEEGREGATSLFLPGPRPFTLRKLECSKRARKISPLNTSAWDNGIGPRSCFRWFIIGNGVMIDRDSWGHRYLIVRGEILGFMKDRLPRKHLPRMFSLIKNES